MRKTGGTAPQDIDIDNEHIKLTSFRASGTSALLEIGANAQQIVVGRRSMGRVARWFAGSLSASLAEESTVPVTVIRTASDEDIDVQDQIANALSPGDDQVQMSCVAASTQVRSLSASFWRSSSTSCSVCGSGPMSHEYDQPYTAFTDCPESTA